MPIASAGIKMSENTIIASTPSRRNGCSEISIASSGVLHTSKNARFARISRYSGKYRPACRIIHTGRRGTASPRHARKNSSFRFIESFVNSHRRSYWFASKNNKSRHSLPATMTDFCPKGQSRTANRPALSSPHRNVRPAAALVRSPMRWAILNNCRFGATGGRATGKRSRGRGPQATTRCLISSYS